MTHPSPDAHRLRPIAKAAPREPAAPMRLRDKLGLIVVVLVAVIALMVAVGVGFWLVRDLQNSCPSSDTSGLCG